MKPGEGHHVHGELPEVGVQLSWEPEAGGDTGHGEGDEVVEVAIGGGGQFESSEADVIKSLVINTVGLVSVFNQLMYGQCGVVGFHNSVRDLQ